MNKVVKVMSMIAIMIAVIAMTVSVQAYTNQDVISYVTKAHTVNGRTVQLSQTQRQSLTQYLNENPVTESEANDIIAKLDKAKSLIDNSGATNLSQLSSSIKGEVISLVKEAGRIAELDVQVDMENETVTIKTLKGKVIISATSYSQFNKDVQKPGTTTTTNSGSTSNGSTTTGKKLVYTGNTNTAGIQTIVAIVAIAIAGVCIKKYAK